jgi:hypothetical protein
LVADADGKEQREGGVMKQKPEFALAKKLPGTSQMERVRAARAILHSRAGSEALAFQGFMAIFHPEVSTDVVRDAAREISDRERRR